MNYFTEEELKDLYKMYGLGYSKFGDLCAEDSKELNRIKDIDTKYLHKSKNKLICTPLYWLCKNDSNQLYRININTKHLYVSIKTMFSPFYCLCVNNSKHLYRLVNIDTKALYFKGLFNESAYKHLLKNNSEVLDKLDYVCHV